MAGKTAKVRYLDVWMNGELVGYWAYSSRAGHEFRYNVEWLNNRLCRPLSLSLPLSNELRPFTGAPVENYFDNLLPDSLEIRKRLATRFGATAASAFELLAKIGRDCVGAVQLLPGGSPSPDVRRIDAVRLTATDVERVLDAAVGGKSIGAVDDEEDLRISLAGAQEKTSLLWHRGHWCRPRHATPATHIFKLPLGDVGGMRADFSTSIENEWLCSKIAAAYGLPVAECEMAKFGRHKVLVVTRFDRRKLKSWWVRLPQEDFCQVYRLSCTQKYQQGGGPGIDDILGTLRGSVQAQEDRNTFLAAQLLFWILAAPDGHAKNFSIFIEPQGRFRLTPLYDILSAWPAIGTGARQLQWKKVKMAMAVRARNVHYRMAEIQRRHWNAVAKRNAMGVDFEGVIQRFVEATPRVLATVAAQLPPRFPAAVSEPIFAGIRAQVQRLG